MDFFLKNLNLKFQILLLKMEKQEFIVLRIKILLTCLNLKVKVQTNTIFFYKFERLNIWNNFYRFLSLVQFNGPQLFLKKVTLLPCFLLFPLLSYLHTSANR